MGYDGGSMSIYDALSYNIKIIAPEDSYHVGINSPYLFQNKSHFFEILDSIVLQQINNCKILEDRSIKNYCENLVNVFDDIWNHRTVEAVKIPSYGNNLDDHFINKNYSKLSLSRLRSYLIRWFF